MASKRRGRRVNVRLSHSSMDRLEKYIGNTISEFKKSVGITYATELADRIDINFKTLITNSITDLRYSTGELVDSTKVTLSFGKDNRPFRFRITISNSCPYFKYFEYGTGVIGSEGPENPMAPDDWEFDVNDHGEEGWRFYKKNIQTGKIISFKTLGQEAKCTLPRLKELIKIQIPEDISKKIRISPPRNNY